MSNNANLPRQLLFIGSLQRHTPNDARPWGAVRRTTSQTTTGFRRYPRFLHKGLRWTKTLQTHTTTSRGFTQRKVKTLERAVALDANPSRLDTLAYVYYRHGAYTKAEQAILRAINLEPNNTAYKIRLGEIRQAMAEVQK